MADGSLPFASRRDVRREGVLAVHDHGQRLAVVGLLKRGGAANQHVQDHPERPDVWKRNGTHELTLYRNVAEM